MYLELAEDEKHKFVAFRTATELTIIILQDTAHDQNLLLHELSPKMQPASHSLVYYIRIGLISKCKRNNKTNFAFYIGCEIK